MKILFVAQWLFPDSIGGAGRYVHDLASSLRARGHHIVILTQQCGGGAADETRDGVRIIRYGALHHWWQVPQTLRAVRRWFRVLQNEQPFDVLVVHHPLPAMALLFMREARRLPWVYHFQSPWGEESFFYHGQRRNLAAWMGWWFRTAIEGRVMRQARARITLSHSMQAILLMTHHVPSDTVHVIPGGVDLERFCPAPSSTSVRPSLGLPAERRLLLTVRALVARQNLDALVRAMREIVQHEPQTLLCIGGDGPLRAMLQALIVTLELQAHVRLLGSIPDETLPRWYQAADLFVMPSKALEGFGLATLEALACGTPVVGTPIGGTQELLTQFDETCLATGTEPHAIATAIVKTLHRLNTAGAAQDLSMRARVFATQFSLGTMAERIERLYQRVAQPKILHVHTLPVISGSGLNTWLSMRGQREASYTVELACAPGGSLADLVKQGGCRVRPIRHFRQPLHPWHDLLALCELWRLCRRERYAIVHTHNSKAGFVGRLAARLAGTPIIIHTVHGFAFHDREPWWRRRLFIRLERLAARWCDQYICISQPLIEWAVQVGIAPRAKMVKIYSGIELAQFQHSGDTPAIRRSFGWSEDILIIGEVAKLWPGKGHDVLLRAFARIHTEAPQARLLLVGEGSTQVRLEQLTRYLGLTPYVRWLGFRADIPQLTHALDIAVLPSLFEGMGRAVLEAMACGKPVVASRVGGVVELVDEGITGFLVPPSDVDALAAALMKLLQDGNLRARMGRAGREKVTQQFDAGAMSRQILAVYRTWLHRNAASDAHDITA